ncbi:hypothetical protein A4H97_18110 [Niastella yeongjuensis]|uniref:DUF202 domain-containing protein n=1 Tax=Niastella yeongjuensis TaxID=354355 RepID=A0A1V9DXP0_9BACT|nr:DUF202 domain-containing protein [Niastella yeongjuensis]OQP38638.1 hypothetical protein A4H97_18110 [Niastella yeongjuensis]SEO38550.1 putative membrane protein [Niastella yeongjuensis]
MEEDQNKDIPKSGNLENDKVTDIQKKIEEKITEDESLGGEALSGELSKDRTHMSEHRTRMSEHRTGLSEHRTELSEHRTDLSDTRTDLSYQRTALSYERTLMSWIRTAISLISFGFTIYKVFEELYKDETHPRLLSPRKVGMLMILFGFIGLLFAQIQHNIAYKKLKAEYPQIQKSLSSVLSVLILVFGLILFLAALFRQ